MNFFSETYKCIYEKNAILAWKEQAGLRQTITPRMRDLTRKDCRTIGTILLRMWKKRAECIRGNSGMEYDRMRSEASR